ncbi:MAG: YraN family protein [Rubrimonas sp.]
MSNPRRAWGRRNHKAGLAAEETAATLYRERGAEVLARRWRSGRDAGGGEIDLIVRFPDILVFVEVKAGRSAAARDAISPAQWLRLEAAAQAYMVSSQTGDLPVRFDAVFVGPDGAADVVENARMSEAW